MTSINIYTDGSCNSRTNRCGYGVHFPNNEHPPISRKFNNTPTNQRAELYAIYKALSIATKLVPTPSTINIYSDSEYSIKSVTVWIETWKQNDWKTSAKKPVKNLDIIKPIYRILQTYPHTIKFQHVRSHTNNTDVHSINNAIADQLAKEGSEKP
jgi:ribonuclease HI